MNNAACLQCAFCGRNIGTGETIFAYATVSLCSEDCRTKYNLRDAAAAALKLSPPPKPPKEIINHPEHYNRHPSGVECIQIIQHFGFNVGAAIKHLWRAGLKTESSLEDLKKARRYIDFEIERVEGRFSA